MKDTQKRFTILPHPDEKYDCHLVGVFFCDRCCRCSHLEEGSYGLVPFYFDDCTGETLCAYCRQEKQRGNDT